MQVKLQAENHTLSYAYSKENPWRTRRYDELIFLLQKLQKDSSLFTMVNFRKVQQYLVYFATTSMKF